MILINFSPVESLAYFPLDNLSNEKTSFILSNTARQMILHEASYFIFRYVIILSVTFLFSVLKCFLSFFLD